LLANGLWLERERAGARFDQSRSEHRERRSRNRDAKPYCLESTICADGAFA